MSAPKAEKRPNVGNVQVHDARRGRGKPTKYRPEYCEIARQFCETGATDQELADRLEIHPSTLYRWFAEHPEFREAVRLGKDCADERVLRAFYHRCVGYEFEAVKIMQDKGVPVVVRYTEHVPPDPGAAFNWLKNRRPKEWRDRHEVTGPDGEPVTLRCVIEFVSPTDDSAGSAKIPTHSTNRGTNCGKW